MIYVNLVFYAWGIYLIVNGDISPLTIFMTFTNMGAILITMRRDKNV